MISQISMDLCQDWFSYTKFDEGNSEGFHPKPSLTIGLSSLCTCSNIDILVNLREPNGGYADMFELEVKYKSYCLS